MTTTTSPVSGALFDMHFAMASRDNVSSQAIIQHAQLGSDLFTAVSAALATLGNRHAPIVQTCDLYNGDWNSAIVYLTTTKTTVPGFGSHWYRGEPDPVVSAFIESLSDESQDKMDGITTCVQACSGKSLWPNAALATAAAAAELGLDPHQAPSLVIQARTPVWVDLFNQHYKEF